MFRLRHPITLLIISILILFGVLRSFSPPEPRGADAPDVVFSAHRADAILRDLLQEGVPHVSGSPYNDVVRNRVIAQLESFGYETEIQSRFHCNAFSVPAARLTTLSRLNQAQREKMRFCSLLTMTVGGPVPVLQIAAQEPRRFWKLRAWQRIFRPLKTILFSSFPTRRKMD